MAEIYFTDGEIREVSPMNGSWFTLVELQRIVNGYVEIVFLDNGELLVCNEDGKIEELPPNPRATLYAAAHRANFFDVISGIALIADRKEIR